MTNIIPGSTTGSQAANIINITTASAIYAYTKIGAAARDSGTLYSSIDTDGTLKAGAVDGSTILLDGVVTNTKLATDVRVGSLAALIALHKNSLEEAINELLLVALSGTYKKLFGSSMIGYWPLDDLTGTDARDVSGNNKNATYRGDITRGSIAQPDGNDKAASWGGVNGSLDIYPIAPLFNPAEGAFLYFIKPVSPFWSDGVTHRLFQFYADASNKINVFKLVDGRVQLDYVAGGIDSQIILPLETIAWTLLSYSWTKAGDTIQLGINGFNYIWPRTGLGTWVGALSPTQTVVGASDNSGAGSFIGGGAQCLMLNRPVTEAECQAVFSNILPNKNLTIIGDSISNPGYAVIQSYPYHVAAMIGMTVKNHAVSSQSIMGHMDAQTAAAAGDNAEIIIIALGTNDDNAGNMTTLQAKVELDIVALQRSNPRATIYYLNVLPQWTDVGGGTVSDNSNIRLAIAAACTAKSITCWDPFTTPWITAADTFDGLHPNDAGHVKITTQILSLLP